jgi:endonuclease III
MVTLAQILEHLEGFYGPQTPSWPTDPYLFLVWWHCGYPASDAACAKGWDSLQSRIGVDPRSLLTASASKLAAALKPGGMVPEVRAQRLKQIAERVETEFAGDLTSALKAMPLSKTRAALKKFPNIADAGADRILLFGGLAPIAAVPSNATQVLVRIRRGREHENYSRNYVDGQGVIEAETAASFDLRARAYLLVKEHGQRLCKRTNPKCDECPISSACMWQDRR